MPQCSDRGLEGAGFKGDAKKSTGAGGRVKNNFHRDTTLEVWGWAGQGGPEGGNSLRGSQATPVSLSVARNTCPKLVVGVASDHRAPPLRNGTAFGEFRCVGSRNKPHNRSPGRSVHCVSLNITF